MKLFISYSRDDKAWTYELWRALRDDGDYDVWIDRKIVAASDWWTSILENIEKCDCFVVVLTGKCVESIYCRAELDYAIALNKPILPLMLKPSTMPDGLSARRVQYEDITADVSMDKLMVRIMKGLYRVQAALERGDYTAQQAKRPDEPKPKADNAEHIYETFALAEEAASEGETAKAESLFKLVIVADPEGLGIAAAERLGEIKFERDRAIAYSNIVRLAANAATLKGAQAAWRAFVTKYGEYDPEHLVARLIEKPILLANVRELTDTYSPQNEPPLKILLGMGNSLRPSLLRIIAILPPPFAWCDIPVGKLKLSASGDLFDVKTFRIAKYPITNAQFQVFVDDDDGYNDSKWWEYSKDAKNWRQQHQLKPIALEGENYPRTNVTWYEAIAFCRWLSERAYIPISLPTELQWQRAAQGDDGREYPWGSGFDKTRCNTEESKIGRTTPVTQYPSGESPFDVMDMSGNALEWCLSKGTENYQFLEDNDIAGNDHRVLRGGSFHHEQQKALTAFRLPYDPSHRDYDVGFRIVCLA